MRILIKKGHVIDPVNNNDGIFDVLIEKGRIVKFNKRINTKADVVIDAKEKIVCPGFIDMHSHFREPGREDEETIHTGLRAAVKGGFTSVCVMPNTTPSCDNQSIVSFLIGSAKRLKLANLFPIGAITKNRAGKELTEMDELKKAGCIAFSDDGDSVEDSGLMRHALEYASMVEIPVISHCEDRRLSQHGVMHEGLTSTILGLPAIPSEAESVIVKRDIELAKMACAKLHIAHVSAKESIDIIKSGKTMNITCEVTPHHLALIDMCVKTFDTNTKVNPPLRDQEDREALKKALKDGIIDVIATDHAPHLESEKDVEFDKAPFGVIGLETALSICIMELIDTDILNWQTLIEKLSVNPSRILNLNRGSLNKGAVADVIIIDPKRQWIYKKEDIESKSYNSPFVNWTLKGVVTDVIVNGMVVMRERRILDEL